MYEGHSFRSPHRFCFQPADFVPFKDRALCERLRKLSGKDLKAPQPGFPHQSDDEPAPGADRHPVRAHPRSCAERPQTHHDPRQSEPETYIPLAQLINYFQVDCRNVHIFAMDEWADDQGNIAPETYKAGFAHSMLKYLVYQIEEKLRMPLENVHYPTNKNISVYSKMITECGEGGADICSSSPGWTGHMAFIDPVDDFIRPTMEEYLQQEARVVTLHPLTIAQNSLHGVFGQSGYVADVPPKAATIGPVDVRNARERIEVHALLTNNTFSPGSA